MTFLNFVTFNYGWLALAALACLTIACIAMATSLVRQAREIRDLKRMLKPVWYDWLKRSAVDK